MVLVLNIQFLRVHKVTKFLRENWGVKNYNFFTVYKCPVIMQ